MSKSAGEGKSNQGEEGTTSQGQDDPKFPKAPKVRARVKLRKMVLYGLEKPKSETSSETQESAQTYHTDNFFTWTILGLMMAGVVMNGMMIGTRLDGMKVANKRMTIPKTQFHWEVSISVRLVVRSVLNG